MGQREIDLSKRSQSKDHKLLLLGAGSSGKSTFFKQLCQIHGNGFQQQDIEQARQNVYDCVIDQMKQLIDSCNDHIEEGDAGYELTGDAKEAAADLGGNKVPRGGVNITPEYQRMITTLWNSEAIKLTFNTRTNLGVVDSAPHFFEDIERIGAPNYQPTEEDILLVRIQTTGMRTAKFSVDNNNFTIVDVGGQRNERSKWIHQFSVVDAVLFVASLSCYDQMKQLIDSCNDHIEEGDAGYALTGDAKEAAADLGGNKVPRGGVTFKPDYQRMIPTLWDSAAIKLTFNTRTNLGVVD